MYLVDKQQGRDSSVFFLCQAEDGIRDGHVTGVQTCALPILSDCGLATASPAQAGLVWTYTANTRCPGGGTLTLIVDRGKTFQTTGGATVETTRVSISYPFQWRFSSVIRVLIRTARYLRVTYISNESVMQNLN